MMRMPTPRRVLQLFGSGVVALAWLPAATQGLSSPRVVRVCQNKHCCRQWTHQQNLPETFLELLPPDVNGNNGGGCGIISNNNNIEIEVTGCLSECGKGPNLVLNYKKHEDPQQRQVFLQGMTGPIQLAQELQEHFGIRVPSKLLAAATVMDKARKADTFEEKERCLSSVIRVLQDDPLLRASNANFGAHVLRAEVRYEHGMVEEALRDLNEAQPIALLTEATTNSQQQEPPKNKFAGSLLGRACRAQADCYQSLGRLDEAEQALLQWAAHDPSRRTKAMKEIQFLRQSSTV